MKVTVGSNFESDKPLDDKQVFMCIVPTMDSKILIPTAVNLFIIAHQLGRNLLIQSDPSPGIPIGRSICMEILKARFQKPIIRALWLDSDILINDFTGIVESIKWADQTGNTIVGKYKHGNPDRLTNVLYKSKDKDAMDPYSDEEIDKFDGDYMPVKYAGMGFVYGDVPLDYTFHCDRTGEDFYYFHDNQYLFKDKLFLAKKVKISHQKTVFLK